MLLHAARHGLSRQHRPENLLAALAAKFLSRLYWPAASVAEHGASDTISPTHNF
jgi:hypothetical protein